MFALHPQLARDCIPIGDFALTRLLLMNDANYPWLILVPRREGIREIYQLSANDQRRLIRESSYLARQLKEGLHAHKINIAALGNQVPQLHIHHVARYENDPAWPRPVWGAVPPRPYTAQVLTTMQDTLYALLTEDFNLL
ncbi:MAG: HIT family protein [Gammaproteobacteria bacterium]